MGSVVVVADQEMVMMPSDQMWLDHTAMQPV